MSFIADKQTLEDLNILGKFRPYSIYSIFNKVITPGGERLLEDMFRFPLVDHNQINGRCAMLHYFKQQVIELPFTSQDFKIAEDYLGIGVSTNIAVAGISVIVKKLKQSYLNDNGYKSIVAGLTMTSEICFQLDQFLLKMEDKEDNPYRNKASAIKKILSSDQVRELYTIRGKNKLTLWDVARYDFALRKKMRSQMEELLHHIYELDVFIAVSRVAREKKFSFPRAVSGDLNVLSTSGVWHPGLNKGVANPLNLSETENMLFLTGANMAGKSTLMKSVGISIYLAHMGFPVAAVDMEFSVRDGLYTSINVPDNINLGYSHFYAEVVRVKQAALHVSNKKKMVIIFDELFKGTNVKDAYDATLAVSQAFAKHRNCFFIISTHIIEVGHALQMNHSNIIFGYMPTIMDGHIPTYPYKLTEGITSDRHGMMIIQNERILELLS